jgi:hypothetical protein
MNDMPRTVLYDNDDDDADKQGGERQRSVVIATAWDSGVKELVVVTMLAHPNAGYGAAIQRLSPEGESAKIVLDENGVAVVAQELMRWIQRHRATASGKGM